MIYSSGEVSVGDVFYVLPSLFLLSLRKKERAERGQVGMSLDRGKGLRRKCLAFFVKGEKNK